MEKTKLKLLILKGLPASGKTTFARELVSQGWKRVNKDDLRAMIDCGKWSKKNEEIVRISEELLVRNFIQQGYNVVVDDTNFIYEDYWSDIANDIGAEFEVKFFDTPINECLKRDALRGDKGVGTDPIWRMYNKYIRHNIKKPVYNPDLLDAYMVDIDGTLALMKDRSPFDWDRVGEDIPNECVIGVIGDLREMGNQIIIVSGRDECSRIETEKWLELNEIDYDFMIMRPRDDKRGDQIVKKELYEEHIKGKYNVLGVFDDRDSVVALWRSLGLTCFQVEYGDF